MDEGIKKKLEADITLEFLEEYRKLVRKYNRDFFVPEPQIATVNFVEPIKPEEVKDQPTI